MRLQRRLGVTTVFVTHDQVEALAMADELAVMRSGRVVQHGPPLDVYDEPDDVFVGTFLGGPPMGVVQAIAVPAGEGHPEGLRIGPCFVAWPGLTVRGVVLVGIRPEALRLDPDGPLLGSAVGIDDLGHERVVRIAVPDASGDQPIVHLIVGPIGRFGGWEPIRLAVDVERVRLFDPVGGRRLTGPGAATGVAAGVMHH
jgi:ABC-type sugar transport system ATPase subunit